MGLAGKIRPNGERRGNMKRWLWLVLTLAALAAVAASRFPWKG
ncbi:hypothetical protein caldi_16500 [Caldinitratiruptor microaerophilus]|uniref:Uncharacterized protein n=1 Tax=Caldinitratiruptor microaerophilus TaxID=671077 RepID=A0AA35G829_9FIRM|nr:hypothetical protein caldi_16500 [Caldinitratiruptor microaerophilus]